MDGDAVTLALGAGATLLGLACWRASRAPARGGARRAWQAAAILMNLAGLWSMAAAATWEVGIPVWLGLASAGGFLATLVPARRQRPFCRRAVRERRGDSVHARPRAGGLRTAASLSAGLLASTAGALALTLWLPLAPADRAVLAMVMWPPLWAGLTLYPWVAGSLARSLGHLAAFAVLAGGLAAYPFLR